jgi:hypothetical protein
MKTGYEKGRLRLPVAAACPNVIAEEVQKVCDDGILIYYHSSGHYPSSCLLFKTQLNSMGYENIFVNVFVTLAT